jgi:hypothetical protein
MGRVIKVHPMPGRYAEIIAQILDAMAFLLVTPEFLGEQTLHSIRENFSKINNFLASPLGSTRWFGWLLRFFSSDPGDFLLRIYRSFFIRYVSPLPKGFVISFGFITAASVYYINSQRF